MLKGTHQLCFACTSDVTTLPSESTSLSKWSLALDKEQMSLNRLSKRPGAGLTSTFRMKVHRRRAQDPQSGSLTCGTSANLAPSFEQCLSTRTHTHTHTPHPLETPPFSVLPAGPGVDDLELGQPELPDAWVIGLRHGAHFFPQGLAKSPLRALLGTRETWQKQIGNLENLGKRDFSCNDPENFAEWNLEPGPCDFSRASLA